ncbi:hypothetical protein M9458_010861, partial [Cirrhinus mrigala]
SYAYVISPLSPLATGTFDALAGTTPNVLGLSPYPTAFQPSARNFFLTRVGPLPPVISTS